MQQTLKQVVDERISFLKEQINPRNKPEENKTFQLQMDAIRYAIATLGGNDEIRGLGGNDLICGVMRVMMRCLAALVVTAWRAKLVMTTSTALTV